MLGGGFPRKEFSKENFTLREFAGIPIQKFVFFVLIVFADSIGGWMCLGDFFHRGYSTVEILNCGIFAGGTFNTGIFHRSKFPQEGDFR